MLDIKSSETSGLYFHKSDLHSLIIFIEDAVRCLSGRDLD